MLPSSGQIFFIVPGRDSNEGGIIGDLECVVDVIVENLVACALYVHVQQPVVPGMVEACVNCGLFGTANWSGDNRRGLPYGVKDKIALNVQNLNVGWVVYCEGSWIFWNPERCSG